jgi:hypothetical protein
MDYFESTLDCVDPFYKSGTVKGITSKFVDEEVKKKFLYNISNSTNSDKIIFHNTTSDKFFVLNTKTFNLIYIDGCHELGYIERDMTNSFNCLCKNGIMWMDDYCGGDGKIKLFMDKWLDTYKSKFKLIHVGYQVGIQKL